MKVLLSELKGGVLSLTLHRPEKANALSAELVRSLLEALRQAHKDESVSVVTLSGSGSSFCGGADTSEIKASPKGRQIAIESYIKLMELIRDLDKPFLVGVNGPAVGGGLGLAATGDYIIASEKAHFRTPELKLGLFPFIISPILIPQIGRKRFFEIVYTGRPVPPDTALAWGLINEVVAPSRLEPRLHELASEIAKAPPEPIRRGKQAIRGAKNFEELGEELKRLMRTL